MAVPHSLARVSRWFQRVLQANQNLLSRQSYAYDYRVNGAPALT